MVARHIYRFYRNIESIKPHGKQSEHLRTFPKNLSHFFPFSELTSLDILPEFLHGFQWFHRGISPVFPQAPAGPGGGGATPAAGGAAAGGAGDRGASEEIVGISGENPWDFCGDWMVI